MDGAEVGGKYADPSMRMVVLRASGVRGTGRGVEGLGEALIKSDRCRCWWRRDHAEQVYRLVLINRGDQIYRKRGPPRSSRALSHEFEHDTHYLRRNGEDIEPAAELGSDPRLKRPLAGYRHIDGRPSSIHGGDPSTTIDYWA